MTTPQPPLQTLALIFAVQLAALLLAAALLHLIPKLGTPGRALADRLIRAPGLDLVITWFTALPMIVCPIVAANLIDMPLAWLAGLGVGVAAQVLTVMLWTVAHELAHPAARKGPRIVHQLNRTVGRWRNHTAVWITALAVPLFFVVRVVEYVVYPPLTWLIRLPKYNSGDWVNVSRQKFEGLVGHDLIWCLYCDWMTGVWSLGSEMLRNVESFWCPIRFRHDKKCANCAVDFPDVNAGWAPAEGTMQDVVDTLAGKYPGPNNDNQWFNHPARLTHNGKPIDAPSAEHTP